MQHVESRSQALHAHPAKGHCALHTQNAPPPDDVK